MRLKKIAKEQKRTVQYDQEDLPDLIPVEQHKMGRLMKRMAEQKYVNKTVEEIDPLEVDDYTEAYCYTPEEKEHWRDAYIAIRNIYRTAQKFLMANELSRFAFSVEHMKYSLHNIGSPKSRDPFGGFSTITAIQMMYNGGRYTKIKEFFENMSKDHHNYKESRRIISYFEDLEDALKKITLTIRPDGDDILKWIYKTYGQEAEDIMNNFFIKNYGSVYDNSPKLEKFINEHRSDWQKILAYEIKKYQEQKQTISSTMSPQQIREWIKKQFQEHEADWYNDSNSDEKLSSLVNKYGDKVYDVITDIIRDFAPKSYVNKEQQELNDAYQRGKESGKSFEQNKPWYQRLL